ncbi:TetR/AcrR family transcriptional regulator [Streptomyces sp. NPDC093228]|jgi:AcrR family transcriptional regulator|uniref:TetR/AcrR family transcriptional regulator n=1 Tax=unclassified Streptomyces TaxID=2593676 RepID=UPI0007410ECE|nr:MULTISPECIES: TetR/AcrR family transcriptional regulator [unclassified Streptomyces]KUJ38490.1 TetR family transcriptional regulator [Streptomyces sp. NRRL F-5122]MDX3258475.1 TetR/AcrR family transcriptional regulator [Streptomyces sp. MI02-2A]REE58114.1 TetR family transcriptional regulator [Streptomyces sp. 3212.3]
MSTTADRSRRLGAKGNRTRQRILDAAETVFVELGYHDASIVKITEAAGVAQGTFYIYFPGKRELFEELVDDLNRRVRQAMTTASESGGSRLAAERAGFAAYFAFVADHPGLYRIMRQAEFVAPHQLRQHYDRIVSGYTKRLRAAMDSGEIPPGEPELMAWALMGLGEMVGMRWVLWHDNEPVPENVLADTASVVARILGVQE